MHQETYLERKLRQLGLSQDAQTTSNTKRFIFRLYFPRPPYGPVQYSAAKQGDGLNFVGQLLGHGGCTLKKIQTDSGTRVEVHDGKGNLNGTHPSYTDPSLHAVVYADSREKLTTAAKMISEVLQPIDAAFEQFTVTPGGSALLKPVVKNKIPCSDTSTVNRNQRGQWGGASTPSSDSSLAHGTDLDSAFVHEQSSSSSPPWRPAITAPTKPPQFSKSVSVPAKVQTATGMKEWDTWGRNNCDGYNQFTMLAQNLVSQCARSRQMKQDANHRSYDDSRTPSSPSPSSWETRINAPKPDNYNSFEPISFSPAPLRSSKLRGIWDSCPLDAFPLPQVYEDLIGATVDMPKHAPIQQSRLTSAYQLPADLEMPSACPERFPRHFSLPQDL